MRETISRAVFISPGHLGITSTSRSMTSMGINHLLFEVIKQRDFEKHYGAPNGSPLLDLVNYQPEDEQVDR